MRLTCDDRYVGFIRRQPCIFVPGEGHLALPDVRWLSVPQQMLLARVGRGAHAFASHYSACHQIFVGLLRVSELPITLYESLEVERDATQQQIKRAWHRLSLQFHPDRSRVHHTYATRKFAVISAAHDVLSDPVRRLRYDQFGDESIGLPPGDDAADVQPQSPPPSSCEGGAGRACRSGVGEHAHYYYYYYYDYYYDYYYEHYEHYEYYCHYYYYYYRYYSSFSSSSYYYYCCCCYYYY